MALPAFLQRIVDWLEAGYPHGVPPQDYYPLLAFLTRHLTTEEVAEVVATLQAERDPDHEPTSEQVRAAITAVTQAPPSALDVERVEAHLRGAGWPMAAAEADRNSPR